MMLNGKDRFRMCVLERGSEMWMFNQQRDCEANFLLEPVAQTRELLIKVKNLFFKFE